VEVARGGGGGGAVCDADLLRVLAEPCVCEATATVARSQLGPIDGEVAGNGTPPAPGLAKTAAGPKRAC
jgi:hypothetical protein